MSSTAGQSPPRWVAANARRRRSCWAPAVQLRTRQSCCPHPFDESSDGCLADRCRTVLLVEHHRSETHRLVHDEVIALLVPVEDLLALDFVAERGDQLRRLDPGADADASAAAVAIEIGGNDELLVGERVGCRQPRPRFRCASGTGPAVGGARRPGRGRPAQSVAPVCSATTSPKSTWTLLRRAMSAARSRMRATSRRSARSWWSWPHTIRTRSARSAGSSSALPRKTSRSSRIAAITHARPRSASAAGDHHSRQAGVEGEGEHRSAVRRSVDRRRRAPRAGEATPRPAAALAPGADR